MSSACLFFTVLAPRAALLLFAAVIAVATVSTSPALLHASPMAGMSDGSETADAPSVPKGNVPAGVETALDMLLRGAGPRGDAPDRGILRPLIDFVRSDVDAAKVKPMRREQGAGAFTRATLNVPLQKVLRYCFDPAIPGEAVHPNVLRRSYWLPESDILLHGTQLWDMLDGLKDADAPVVARGAEFEEITPDAFSGCYYNYTLDRLLVLLRVDGRATLLSVTKQRTPSSVGRVGAIVGNDGDWNYAYSKTVGSNLKLAGWAETYMYDSANVAVLFEPSPGARNTEMAFFKYVKAGWAGMNMVKPSHIASGSRRYLEGLRQVLESARLPGAEAIAEQQRKLRGMDETSLRHAIGSYSAGLAARSGSGPLAASGFKKILQSRNSYAEHLDAAEIRSELIKQYVKDQLGKPPLAASPDGSAP